MNTEVSNVNERSRSFGWLSDGEWNVNVMKEMMRKDLKYEESDRDNREELVNLLIWFVKYRVYVG